MRRLPLLQAVVVGYENDSIKWVVDGKTGHYFDRELSWLAFNERVLQEAADPSNPILERLKFLAIYSSNLDEFFRVRVASLRSLLRLKEKKLKALSFNPRRLLLEIHQVVDRQQRRFGDIFRNEILPQLREKGIHLHVTGSQPAGAEFALRRFFADKIAEHVNPIILESNTEAPFLKNGGLYLVVPLWPRDQENPLFAGDPTHGIVDVPSDHVGRFVPISREPGIRHVMFVDDIIRYNLKEIFPFHEAGEAYAIKLTRDADLYIEDEFSGDLVAMIRKSLSKREIGIPTRLLFDQRMPYSTVSGLKRRLQLDDDDLVVGGYYHNFSDFFGFPDFGRADLINEPLPPLTHPSFDGASLVADVVRERDRILHFPYHAFDPVLRFLKESADDDKVTRISMSLYRVAPASAVVDQLVRASRNGKKVRVFVEVKARFDEKHNLDAARMMEDEGIDVLYSMPGIKVHTKLLLVESDSGDIAFLSTGNFNERTARVYCDHGMFTARRQITKDVGGVFDMLAQPGSLPDVHTLLVAPHSLRSGFESLVRDEVVAARKGKPAFITLKMNSLEDESMIDQLYAASAAGVQVRLIVRGICRLIPDGDDASEKIRITSIVDRFLEHARVYVFHAGGANKIYLSSADWMFRNLNRRVEVAWPVLDEAIQDELVEILNLQLSDSCKARVIDRRQTNPIPAPKENSVRSQYATYDLLASRVKRDSKAVTAYSSTR